MKTAPAGIERIRIKTHQLVNPEFNEPERLVAWMGAIQAQDYSMSKWAVGVRLKSATVTDIQTALNSGKILRTHVMRPTWHLVAAEDIRWMLQLSKERIKSSSASRDKALEITEKLYSESHQIICKMLEGNNHLTRQEIAFELTKAGMTVDSSRMTHFMMRAEIEGLVCSGIDKGNKQTYALIDERVPPAKTLHKEEALAALATKYFRSHSPASLRDFAWWSGLSAGDAEQAIRLIRSELFIDRFYDTPLFVHSSFGSEITSVDTFHLLPAFDEYIIAYRDRTSILQPEHYSKAVIKNGIFRPVVVSNGRIIGTWQKTTGKSRIAIEPAFFETGSNESLIKIAENNYGRFISTH
jgi:hypothetical protein